MKKSWEHAAGILWPHLVSAARNKKKLFYSDLAPHVATSSRHVGKALGPILFFCMEERIPPLTSIVVNMHTQVPGSGFTRWETMAISSAQARVYEYDWSKVDNPFGGFGENDTKETFATTLLDDPSKAKSIYLRVKARGSIQAIFRRALIKAYCGRCAVCELSFEEVLEAAHIVPWVNASHSERISPRNGILLCANHHRLFDSGWIQITENRKILISVTPMTTMESST